MKVFDALRARHSVRAFTRQEVPRELLLDLLDQARRAPSGGNLQPWKLYVLAGPARERLTGAIREKIAQNAAVALTGEGAEYQIYPPDLPEPYAARRARVGIQLYESVRIGRGERAARLQQLARNYEFFGASVGMIVTVERCMQPGQYTDLGLFMQSLALLAVEHGLGTCMQESWANWPVTIRALLGVPETELVFCGISLGYPDGAHPINAYRTERADFAEFGRLLET